MSEYSLEKFNKAKESGNEDLSKEEIEFLEKYKEIKEKSWFHKQGFDNEEVFTSDPSVAVVFLASLLTDKNAREIFRKRKTVKELRAKYKNTAAGQLELAEEEAHEFNEQYDEYADKVREAIKEFEEFIEEANGRSVSEKED